MGGEYFMFASVRKAVPVLSLTLALGLEAENTENSYSLKDCGIQENENCMARGCTNALGGALEFDILYWRAQNPGFSCIGYEQKNPYIYRPSSRAAQIAGIEPNAISSNQYLFDVGSEIRLESRWDPGFRIGTGWNTDFDRWDVFVDWTWYKSHPSESKERKDLIFPTLLGFLPVSWAPTTTTTFSSFSASWRILHNAADLELGRAYYMTKAFSLRIHCGLRGSWINQKAKNSFLNPILPTTILTQTKNNFWGIGPRIGINGQWHIAESDWSVLGKASTSLLMGKTRARFQVTGIQPSLTLPLEDFKDNLDLFAPNFQIFLGVDWGSGLDHEKYYVGFNAGWEANIYWNQYNVPATKTPYEFAGIPSHSTEALTMGGLTASIYFDF